MPIAPTSTSLRYAVGDWLAISAAIQPPKPSPTSDTSLTPRSPSSQLCIAAMSRTLRSHCGRSDLPQPGWCGTSTSKFCASVS